MKLMAWSKMQTAIIVGAVVLLAAGTTAVTIEKIISPRPFVRIDGTGQIVLYSGVKSLVVETARMTILTDGKSYRISLVSKGRGTLTNDIYDVTTDYGCDGTDLFEVSDRLSPLHRTHEGIGGFAYPERFPGGFFGDHEFPPTVVQAAWLAYCSRDYLNIPTNQTGLPLMGIGFSPAPDYITNQVTYWTNSTLPQRITGWSRNWIIADRTNSLQPMQAIELPQYPGGFKAWQFTATDPVTIENIQVPRQVTLETFFPKPPNTATTGDETLLLRKATFIADSIEIGKGKLDPLPPVPIPDLEVADSRFQDVAATFVITSHATPKGWPTRGSPTFQQADAFAHKLASDNPADIASSLKTLNPTVIPPSTLKIK